MASAVPVYKPFDADELTKILMKNTARVPKKTFNFYCGAETLDLFWDIIVPKCIDLHGVKLLSAHTYEAIVFDDISKYNRFKLIIYSNSAIDKPPFMVDIDKLERITDTLIRFSLNSKYNLENSDWKLECYE